MEKEGLTEGEMVEIRIRKVGKDLFGALEGMGPFTPEDELRAHGESVVIGATPGWST